MQEINLSTVGQKVDLSKWDAVKFTGEYRGDRITFVNASDTRIILDGKITTTHTEDAICFAGNVSGMSLAGWAGNMIYGGAVTFWGMLTDVFISGLNIYYPHTGIRATQDLPHTRVTVEECNIIAPTHEGVYIGPSKPSENKGKLVTVRGCNILLPGWDGIQIGNTNAAKVYGNTIHRAGVRGTYGQDYGITINPGCVAWVWDNEILETEKPIQVIEARCFHHAP